MSKKTPVPCPLCSKQPNIRQHVPNKIMDWTARCSTPGCPNAVEIVRGTKDMTIIGWNNFVSDLEKKIGEHIQPVIAHAATSYFIKLDRVAQTLANSIWADVLEEMPVGYGDITEQVAKELTFKEYFTKAFKMGAAWVEGGCPDDIIEQIKQEEESQQGGKQ